MVYKYLDSALDAGIKESDFWNMTFAEVRRAVESHNRVLLAQAKNQAIYDYNLSELIGRSVARLFSSNNKMPTLAEAYPGLFDEKQEEETAQEQKEELYALRFRQFAASYNQKYEGGKK